MDRKHLAKLAQQCADSLTMLPESFSVAVIVTDESGAFVGVGSNRDKTYMDKLVWCAAHGEDRIDHVAKDKPEHAAVNDPPTWKEPATPLTPAQQLHKVLQFSQLICLGVIGEYLSRIYMVQNRKPPFAIKTLLNDEVL